MQLSSHEFHFLKFDDPYYGNRTLLDQIPSFDRDTCGPQNPNNRCHIQIINQCIKDFFEYFLYLEEDMTPNN